MRKECEKIEADWQAAQERRKKARQATRDRWQPWRDRREEYLREVGRKEPKR